MKNIFFICVLSVFLCSTGFSQDKVLLKNGTMIEAKVLEVGTDEVKYQLYTKTGDGAIYIVPKSQIELIEFENGYREEFKSISTEMADLSKKHLIGLNYIDLIGLNLSFDYEYFFSGNRDFSLYVPLRIGFPQSVLHNYSKNVIETGAGVFVYPYRRKKFNYFTGLETVYANRKIKDYDYDIYGNYTYTEEHRHYMGMYITNGIKLNFRERFGLGYSFSFGIWSNLDGGATDAIAKGNMSFFYRF